MPHTYSLQSAMLFDMIKTKTDCSNFISDSNEMRNSVQNLENNAEIICDVHESILTKILIQLYR